MRLTPTLAVIALACSTPQPAPQSPPERSERQDRRERVQERENAYKAILAQQRAEYSERQETRRQAREEERQREAEDKQTAAEADRLLRIDYLRKLGPEGREKKLRDCLRAPLHCTKLMLELAEATEGPERERLLAANAQALSSYFSSSASVPTGSIVCCSSQVSESCVCGGKLAGCCSDSGGVCGCGF